MNKEELILKEIFENDPEGLLESETKTNIPEEAKLIEHFKQITSFYEKYNREPAANKEDYYEFQLFARLNNLRKNKTAINYLKNYDKHELLFLNKTTISSFEDIFKDDPDGLLNNDENDLFNLKGPIKDFERAKTDFVARRKPCKNFNKYEERFKKIHLDLSEGKRQIIPFRENMLKEDNYFIHNGIVFLLAKIDIFEESQAFSSGERKRMDGRTRCIFENATESNMKFRSLAKILNQNGKCITQNVDDVNREFEKISEDNIQTGIIYVLRSKSNDEKISSIENLYKIGYTKDLKKRIKNPENDPTFLMAPVEIMANYEVYDVPAIRIESIIQKFFKSCQLKLEITDKKREQYKPDEWYIVPIDVIEQVIELLNKNKLSNYKYDHENMLIIPKKNIF